jgi:hypothetical protein
MTVLDDWLKLVETDGIKITRAVSLLAASVHVAGMNVALATHLGAQPYQHDTVLTIARRFEQHIDAGK